MTKYRFHIGDIVKAVGNPAKAPVIGKVLSMSTGSGAHWYKIESRGEAYNCREDELEIVRWKKKAMRDQVTLEWRRMDVPPEDGQRCLIWVDDDDLPFPFLEARYAPDDTGGAADAFMVDNGTSGRVYFPGEVIAWSPWRWPNIDREDEE